MLLLLLVVASVVAFAIVFVVVFVARCCFAYVVACFCFHRRCFFVVAVVVVGAWDVWCRLCFKKLESGKAATFRCRRGSAAQRKAFRSASARRRRSSSSSFSVDRPSPWKGKAGSFSPPHVFASEGHSSCQRSPGREVVAAVDSKGSCWRRLLCAARLQTAEVHLSSIELRRCQKQLLFLFFIWKLQPKGAASQNAFGSGPKVMGMKGNAFLLQKRLKNADWLFGAKVKEAAGLYSDNKTVCAAVGAADSFRLLLLPLLLTASRRCCCCHCCWPLPAVAAVDSVPLLLLAARLTVAVAAVAGPFPLLLPLLLTAPRYCRRLPPAVVAVVTAVDSFLLLLLLSTSPRCWCCWFLPAVAVAVAFDCFPLLLLSLLLTPSRCCCCCCCCSLPCRCCCCCCCCWGLPAVAAAAAVDCVPLLLLTPSRLLVLFTSSLCCCCCCCWGWLLPAVGAVDFFPMSLLFLLTPPRCWCGGLLPALPAASEADFLPPLVLRLLLTFSRCCAVAAVDSASKLVLLIPSRCCGCCWPFHVVAACAVADSFPLQRLLLLLLTPSRCCCCCCWFVPAGAAGGAVDCAPPLLLLLLTPFRWCCCCWWLLPDVGAVESFTLLMLPPLLILSGCCCRMRPAVGDVAVDSFPLLVLLLLLTSSRRWYCRWCCLLPAVGEIPSTVMVMMMRLFWAAFLLHSNVAVDGWIARRHIAAHSNATLWVTDLPLHRLLTAKPLLPTSPHCTSSSHAVTPSFSCLRRGSASIRGDGMTSLEHVILQAEQPEKCRVGWWYFRPWWLRDKTWRWKWSGWPPSSVEAPFWIATRHQQCEGNYSMGCLAGVAPILGFLAFPFMPSSLEPPLLSSTAVNFVINSC